MSTRNPSSSQILGALLLCLPFLVAGAFAGYLLWTDVRDWYAVRDYVPVPAQLEMPDLLADESMNAKYHYTYHEKSYTSTRAGVNDGSKGRRDLYQKLLKARDQEQPVTAWIDPQQPSRAVLDRAMPWDILAIKLLIFLPSAFFGLVILIRIFKVSSSVPITVAGITLPDNIRINDKHQIISNPSWVIIYWVVAVLFTFIPATFLFTGRPQPWFVDLFLCFFLLIGLLSLLAAVLLTVERLRSGALALTMQPLPAVIGGMLHGSLDLRQRLADNVPYNATLTCLRRIHPRHRSAYDLTVWQDKVTATCSTGPQGSHIDFHIAVPAGLPASEEWSRDYHYWILHIESKVRSPLSLRLDHYFNIPVIAGKPAVMPAPVKNPVSEIPTYIVRIDHAGSSVVFYYPPLRNRSHGIKVLVFGSVILTLMAFLPMPPIPLFVLLFLLVPAVMPLAGLYYLANSLRVEATSRGLITTRKVFGIPCMRRRASIGEIIKISYRTIPGHYQLAAHLRDGREIIVGDGIPWLLAEHLQRQLQEALRLKQP